MVNQLVSPRKGEPVKRRYKTMLDKTFKTAVLHLIETNYGGLGGGRKLAELLADDVDTLASTFFVSREFVKPGQMVISAVAKSDKPRVGKTIRETQLKPVVVTVYSEEEMMKWIAGTTNLELKKQRMARILRDVFECGGVLHLGDIALLHLCRVSTAAKYVHDYEREHNTVLPYRGTVHDLGPTTTHKEWIIGEYLKGKSHSQIKAETGHSTTSISAYIKGYRRVMILKKYFSQDDIAFITGLSKKLVGQYLKIGEQQNGRVI